jgi:hypothetical protein
MGILKLLFAPANRYRLLGSLILIERIVGVLVYNLRFGDSDQTIMWNMAKEMMDGLFYSFTFYGQSYNIVLEVFLALPLLKMGLSYPLSFAIVTSSLAILPYGILSSLYRKKMGDLAGLIPLLALLLMPPEFLMLSSISRGFVQGIALSSIALYCWAGVEHKAGAIIAGFLLPLAVLCNPNSILFLPIFLFFFRADLNRILLTFTGMLMSLPLVYWHVRWWQLHPEKIMHPAPGTELSTEYAWMVLTHLDDYFNHITPLFWRAAWLLIPFFFVLLILLIRKSEWPGKIAALAWVIGLTASVFIYKTTDATSSIYFSGGRMYLAWPLILIAVLLQSLPNLLTEKWMKFGILGVCGVFLLKTALLPFFIRNHHQHHTNAIVHVFPHKELWHQCLVVKAISDITQANLIEGVSGHTSNQPIAYGCPCLIPEFPLTYIRGFERKTWLKPLRENATRELSYDGSRVDSGKVGKGSITWHNPQQIFHFRFRISKERAEDS